MSTNILSLDLDWLNFVPDISLSTRIYELFDVIFGRFCKVPAPVILREHHYFYPWVMSLLKGKSCHVVNIDEHHDFYYTDDLSFDPNPGCQTYNHIGYENFFAFMAHDGVLEEYTWVTNDPETLLSSSKRDVNHWLQAASSVKVKEMEGHLSVRSRESIYNVLYGLNFDGFAIIRSPGYTHRHREVCRLVDRCLKKHSIVPQRNSCRATYYRCQLDQIASTKFNQPQVV